MIGKVLGKCELHSIIGSGAMGVVYRGHHRALGVPVALKTIKPDFAQNAELVQRFLQEAQLAARLRHPNVVRVYDVGEEAGVNFIVMEYLEGRTLDVFHREGGLSDQRTFFSVFYALATAIGEAHRKGIVHRDLKPMNVIVGDETKPVLTDFGIAAALSQDARLTSPGILLGTPAYMSPEACRGDGNLSAHSDVYALGMMMYEVLSGGLPHMSDNVLEVLSRRISEIIPPLRSVNAGIPSPLAAVVDRAVAKDARARYADGWELANALAAAYHELFPSAPTDSQPPVDQEPPRVLQLPSEEAESIAQGSDLRYTDLHAIVAAAERASTGYGMVAIHHPDCVDLLLFEGSTLDAVLRWRDGAFCRIALEDVSIHQSETDGSGLVDSYAVSKRYLNAIRAVCCNASLMGGMRMAFVNLDALLGYLQAERASGVLRLQLGGKLGMVLMRDGHPANLFCSAWLRQGQGSSQQSLTQLSSLLTHHPLTQLDFFSLEAGALSSQELPVVEPPLAEPEAEALVTFVTTALATSGQALSKAFGLGAGPILGKFFDETVDAHPALLEGLFLDDGYSVDPRELLDRIDGLPVTGRRTVVVSALGEMVHSRTRAVRAAISSPRKRRKVWKPLLETWRKHETHLAERGLSDTFEPVFRRLQA